MEKEAAICITATRSSVRLMRSEQIATYIESPFFLKIVIFPQSHCRGSILPISSMLSDSSAAVLLPPQCVISAQMYSKVSLFVWFIL